MIQLHLCSRSEEGETLQNVIHASGGEMHEGRAFVKKNIKLYHPHFIIVDILQLNTFTTGCLIYLGEWLSANPVKMIVRCEKMPSPFLIKQVNSSTVLWLRGNRSNTYSILKNLVSHELVRSSLFSQFSGSKVLEVVSAVEIDGCLAQRLNDIVENEDDDWVFAELFEARHNSVLKCSSALNWGVNAAFGITKDKLEKAYLVRKKI